MVIRIDPSIPQDPNSQINQEIGLLEPYINPLGTGFPQLSTIWWAYASSCYLGTNGLGHVRPLLLHEGDQSQLFYTDHRVQTVTELLLAPPHLPRSSQFIEDGLVRRWMHDETAKSGVPPKIEKRPGIFSKGFTNVVYGTGTITNLNGMELPTTVVLSEFQYTPHPILATRLHLVKLIELSVTNVAASLPTGSLTPAITRMISFTDNRFAAASPPVPQIFFSTGAYTQGWPSRYKVEVSSEFVNAKLQTEFRRKFIHDDLEQRGRRMAFRYIILGAIIVPMVLFVYLRAAKHKTNKKSA